VLTLHAVMSTKAFSPPREGMTVFAALALPTGKGFLFSSITPAGNSFSQVSRQGYRNFRTMQAVLTKYVSAV
jgi:hypothetical protein